MTKNDLNQKLADSNQTVDKQNEELKKLNSNLSNWSSKYKLLLDKTKQIEEMETTLSNAGILLKLLN